MKRHNLLTGESIVPICNIQFGYSAGSTHISQILAGYKMLEKQGKIKIASVHPSSTLRTSGNYEHNSIIEVSFGDRIIAYDMADGYQSIHREDIFDHQLDRLSYYFKRSYNPEFHSRMRNSFKVKPLSLNYLCTCNGNPYDQYYQSNNSLSEAYAHFKHIINNKRIIKPDYKIFESNNIEYKEYKLLFLTRIWNGNIATESIKNTYPYFTDEEAKIEADKWNSSLNDATKNRVNYIRSLNDYFGDRIIAGVSADDYSKKLCPDLIIDPAVSERIHYLNMIKQNYICITSEGLHHSIGWKFAEYVAAGKSIISEPLFYEVPYGFEENKNYLVYHDIESCIDKCEILLNNPNTVHKMEKENVNYYKNHVQPDKLVLDSLKILFDV